MKSFSIDENENPVRDPATVQDLCSWANEYDRKYFGGLVARQNSDVHFAIIDDAKGIACFVPGNRTAYVERAITGSEKFCRIAMLHELVHIKLFFSTGDPDEDHGESFKAEINRLLDAGAYANLL